MKKMAWLIAAACVAGGLAGCEKPPAPLTAEDIKIKAPEMPDGVMDGASGRGMPSLNLKILDDQKALFDQRQKAGDAATPAVAVTPAPVPAASAPAGDVPATTTAPVEVPEVPAVPAPPTKTPPATTQDSGGNLPPIDVAPEPPK